MVHVDEEDEDKINPPNRINGVVQVRDTEDAKEEQASRCETEGAATTGGSDKNDMVPGPALAGGNKYKEARNVLLNDLVPMEESAKSSKLELIFHETKNIDVFDFNFVFFLSLFFFLLLMFVL